MNFSVSVFNLYNKQILFLFIMMMIILIIIILF